MKISTSTSFVFASLALSSSTLAVPIPDSPELNASPRSNQAEQFSGHTPSLHGSPSARRMLR